MVQAISGLMSLTGDPDGPPYRAGISVFDVMAGLHATIGILAALQHRDTTPAGPARRGQPAVVGAVRAGQPGSAYVAGGVVPTRMGNATPACSPTSRCPCADGDLIVTAGNDGQFRRLVEVLGVPELADDPRFRGNEDRTAHRDELRPLLVERLATRSTMEWFETIIAAGVPCGPINTIDGGVAFAERSASTRSCSSARATRRCPRCATRSGSPTPRRLPAAAARARRARRRASGAGSPTPASRTTERDA